MRKFDDVWAVCTINKRAIPRDWNKLYQMLNNVKRNPEGGYTPSLPLILAAWYCTMPIEKHLRFREHIVWAEKQNQLDEIGDYLESLSEDDWYHFGEF